MYFKKMKKYFSLRNLIVIVLRIVDKNTLKVWEQKLRHLKLDFFVVFNFRFEEFEV